MNTKPFLLALVATMPLLAEVSGPVLGYVHDNATLRPIIGIPGASYFGTAIDTGDLAIVGISSSARYAIAANSARTQLHVLALRPGEAAQQLATIDNASEIDSVVLS